ncbi:hypothetical protein COU37_03905 [Candidatus Micrarchaeota archaeon CG10_big_fil_rev_8_21_14_0_10_45_29]|nr:MAG: hypothetical protein COU37_03905 [Candidatus Micrarchaeota archaeon CG10_big_fil_rev_8_21_14_0_10_45_29]
MQISVFILVLFLLLGIFAGILPGLHPNSIGAVLAGWLGGEEWLPVGLLIILGAYSALAFLPSIFLGVPEGQTQIALLPGQRMLMEGRGVEAAGVVAFSAIVASLLSALSIPFILPFIPVAFEFVHPFIGYILIFASVMLLLNEGREKNKTNENAQLPEKEKKYCAEEGDWAAFGALAEKGGQMPEKSRKDKDILGEKEKFLLHFKLIKISKALIVFLLAGALGLVVLNMPLKDPLFALFVGFFTMPALMLAKGGQKLPEQQKGGKIGKNCFAYIILGILFGALADLVPGISTPAQIAVFSSVFLRMDDAKNFLAHIASIEASHNVFALASGASVGIARVGMVAIANELSPITNSNLPPLVGAFLFAIGIGAFLLIVFAKRMDLLVRKIDFSFLMKLIAIYLALMIFFNDGMPGLFVLATASMIGYLPRVWGVGRTNVMGSLIIPSIGHAFGF